MWNGASAKTNQTLFVTEAILDGDESLAGGFQERGCALWRERLDGRPRETFTENSTREIFLCLDNDESGEEGTERLKEEVLAEAAG